MNARLCCMISIALTVASPVVSQPSSENFALDGSAEIASSGTLTSEGFSLVATVGESLSSDEMSSESFTVETGLLSLEAEIAIDVMPDDSDNTISTKQRGRVPVALFSSSEFDASEDVDTLSLTLGRTGEEASLVRCANEAEDVNQDGIADQVCFFDAQLLDLREGDTQLVLKGLTSDGGTGLIGIESVNVPN